MNYPEYTYPVEALGAGSSLGNPLAFARFDRETNLRGLWSSTDNRHYIGEWNISFIAGDAALAATETTFTPESQSTMFTGGGWRVRKTCVLPFMTTEEATGHEAELRSLIVLVEVLRSPQGDGKLVVRHEIVAAPGICELFTKQPAPEELDRRYVIQHRKFTAEILTAGAEHEARVFGSSLAWDTCNWNDRSITAEYSLAAGGEQREAMFAISFSPDGIAEAQKGFLLCADAKRLRDSSVASYRRALSRSAIATPDEAINRAIQWAKVNTLRVQHRYRIGHAFTNDPPQDIVVIRDLAWYILGADYLTPQFSRDMLELAGRHAYHEGGKLTEFVHADEREPVKHDYELNINDDTPLFVYALWHHAMAGTGDFGFAQAYPLMKRACDWILTQTRDGLAYCTAKGTYVWGICGWRNIIDGYNLTGAVTEVNAECCAALSLTGAAAKMLGKEEDARRYLDAAAVMRKAVNTALVSDRTGMYLLNRENDGTPHHDITGDLVFPVLFGIAEEGMRKTILAKLTGEEMWTPYGSRTVSPAEKNYDPDSGYQLVGGLWHNLTAWIAYCSRKERPELLVEGMKNIYRLCETPRPRDFGFVVPGQFPERLHGETHVSRGMSMSPWLPPTFLWLAVEGLLGVDPASGAPAMNPHIPRDWTWIAVRNLPWKGEAIDAFLHENVLYASRTLSTGFKSVSGKHCVTASDTEGIFSIGLSNCGEYLLFAASDRDLSGTVSLRDNGEEFRREVTLQGGVPQLLRFTHGDTAHRATSARTGL